MNALIRSFRHAVTAVITALVLLWSPAMAALTLNARAVASLLALGFTATLAEAVEWRSSGSGFLVNGRGDVVTNEHVVQDCSVLSIENAGKNSLAKVITAAPNDDLAVMRLLEPDLLLLVAPRARTAAPKSQPTQDIAQDMDSEENWIAFTGNPASPQTPPAPVQATPQAVAVPSTNAAVQGQKSILIGFPLAGGLCSEPMVTDGIVVSTRGVRDDPRSSNTRSRPIRVLIVEHHCGALCRELESEKKRDRIFNLSFGL